jgi:two-component system CheB/CheR fusion protein
VEIVGNLLGENLPAEVDRILAGVQQQSENEIETATATAEWYVRRVTPYIAIRGTTTAGVVVTWTNITHVKVPDERARRLAAVVKDSNDAVTLFDRKGRFLAWNRAASGMYGYSEAEALRMTVSDLVPAGARQDHLDFIRHAEHDEAAHSYETQRVTKDGRVLDIWLTLFVLSDGRGKAFAVASTERDLVNRSVSNAHLRERAEQLAVAERRKNEFLATLGHELRNPLVELVSAGNLLVSETVAPSQKEWAAAVVKRQSRAMMRLVNDMLDISRITNGTLELERQRVPIETIIRHVVELSAPVVDEHGHTFSVSLPAQPLWLDADPARLSQVIEHMVTNAAKSTAPGGAIHLVGTRMAQRLLLSVTAHGAGIRSSTHPNLFDMLVQATAADRPCESGLAVGLSVVQRLVELHGGSIRATNDGSELIVDLPLGPGPAVGQQGE